MSGKIINKRKNNFTIIPNEIIKAKDLTWKAKGLMCYLLSLSDDWDIHKSDLANRSLDGYESMLSGWNELEKLGYIHSIRVKENNLFKGYNYIVNESRVSHRAPGFTEPGFTEQGNPELINTSSKQVPLLLDTNVSNCIFTFEDFWKIYPVKKAKLKCKQKWNKLSKEDINLIFTTISKFVSEKPFANYNHPYPMTYLNSKVWTDVESENQSTEDSGQDIGDLYAEVRGF